MSSVVTVLVISAGAITGWELANTLFGAPWRLVLRAAQQSQWRLVYVLLLRRSTIASVRIKGEGEEPAGGGWDLAQRRAMRLVKLQNVVRNALPADPELDSPYQRELREAAFGE